MNVWILAARPKTLTGAMAPVIVGGALSVRFFVETSGQWDFTHSLRLALCFLFAILMQIDANFVNDYFDWKKGTDREDRLGPERACAQGWVTPKAMKRAIIITTILSCLAGLPLIIWGGWQLIIVGLLCVVFCFLYTTTMSYLGFGDILVLLFFGLVPITFTHYVLTGQWSLTVIAIALSQGLVTDCLLMINNYRDRNQDRESGKRTIVVRFGPRFALWFYYLLGIIAVIISGAAVYHHTHHWLPLLIFLPFVALHTHTHHRMAQLDGRVLNAILGQTARNIFVFAILLSAIILIG